MLILARRSPIKTLLPAILQAKQGVIYILNDIIRVFKPDGEADHAGAYARG
jgi:hypothetical protein